MKSILIFLTLAVGVSTAHADSLTMTVSNINISFPAGFTAGYQGSLGDDKWKYYTDANGGAVRVMQPMSSTITADTAGNYGLLWFASINQTPFAGQISWSVSLEICKGTQCTPAVFSGAFTGANGYLEPTAALGAQTVRLGGEYVYLTPGINALRTPTSTLDPFLSVRTASVPDVPGLLTLGTGLAFLASRLRKRQ